MIARLVALALLIASIAHADAAPEWLRSAAGGPSPADPRIPAIVLLRDQAVDVQPDGRWLTNGRYAVRVLTREGRDAALTSMTYIVDQSRPRDMRAWLIRPSGEVIRYDKDRVADMAASVNDVYNEVRVRGISAVDDAEPGAVFGCEWSSEERPLFAQMEFQFQNEMPVQRARFSLTLPAGWTSQPATFNHEPIPSRTEGAATIWELADLARIEEEPNSPPVTHLAPRLVVSYAAPAGSRGAPGFASWKEVSRWLTTLSDPQSSPDPALTARARALTAGATTRMDRLRAIARFVQGVHYVSIQTGVGRGGGYRPHAATEVLAKSYGDCKDKANLMRALLAAVDIPAWLVSIYSGDPTYVQEEWPSPQQFNHCIVAIQMPDPKTAGPVVKHATLGSLLLFDPTDPYTPLGELPEHEQGSLALLVAGEAGDLIHVPVLPPETNRLDRTADVTLAPDGSITARLTERSSGPSASDERRYYAGDSEPEYVKRIEHWVARGANGASVSEVKPVDDAASGWFALDVQFTAPHYAQLVQQQLLVFKPALVSRREAVFPTGRERKYPVVLQASALDEKVNVKLPEGFAVDELPTPTRLETTFGSFATTYAVENGELRCTRRLMLKPSTIPVEQYEGVREFFEKMRSADQAAVVLAKK